MKPSLSLAMIVGVLIAALGLMGLIAPETYVRLSQLWEESPGIYVFAIIQLAIGLVLLRAAPSSRSPVGLGVLGAFALAEALVMPLLGQGRAHAIAHWWSEQPSATLRLWAALELFIGVLVVVAVTPRRRHLRAETIGT